MRPGLREAICDAYRFSVAQGHHGFLGDSHVAVRDWSRHLAPVDCPLHLLHGAEDPAVPLSWVRGFCDAHPQARLTALEGCGQLVFFEHPERVLDSVAEMAARP